MKRFTMDEKRRIAIGAARAELRRQGRAPGEVSAEQALDVLDDLMRTKPGLIASQWYAKASEGIRQLKLFRKEWGNV